MEPIRILHMIGSLEVGGSQAMVINLYKAIDREKIQFDFIVDHPDLMELAETVKALGARIYTMPTFVGSNLVSVRRAWHRFFREHPEYKVLHSHVRSYASVYLPIAKKHGLKTIIHSHNTSNGTGMTALVKKALQFPLRYQADYLFSCSEIAGKWLFGEKAVHGSKYRMIPNSINCGRFYYQAENRRRIRDSLGIREDESLIGHVGRFQEAKNHKFLIEIFAQACQINNKLKLLLVGDGPLRPDIEALCAQLGVADRVIFAGIQVDTPSYYHAMDLFLFPSLWEGLPVSVVEAQAAGLNCLLSDAVTKDVQLTDLAQYIPLESGAKHWAEQVLAALPERRAGLSPQQQAQLAGFDSTAVAADLQAFYLSLQER